jgi:hypothetical protein
MMTSPPMRPRVGSDDATRAHHRRPQHSRQGVLIATGNGDRRALDLLADAPHGRTVANMLAHGFTNTMLDGLVRDELAIIEPGTMRTGTRRITVVWVAITEIGREVIGAQPCSQSSPTLPR